MSNKLTKDQRRKKKQDKQRKSEITAKNNEKRIIQDRVQEKMLHDLNVKRQHVQQTYNSQMVACLNLVADRNGCGYYRMIWPYELMATKANIQSLNSFVHTTDFGQLKHFNSIRFQRQVDDNQMNMLKYYIGERDKLGYKYRLQYELDDLVPEIDKSNAVAYNYFKDYIGNHLDMLKMVDAITVSTEQLKKTYTEKYGIDGEKITVIPNTLPKFLYNFTRRVSTNDFTKVKPRVFWSGSGSHAGKGGDLDFFVELVESTLDKYQWVLQGVVEPRLQKYVDEGKIESHPWQDCYSLANYQFYNCRPDVYIATLKPSLFNSCKSDLKLLEASALGVPFIGSKFTGDKDYSDTPSPYEEHNLLTLNNGDIDEWVTTIDRLVNDQDRYMDVVNKQYEILNSRFLEDNLDMWLKSIAL